MARKKRKGTELSVFKGREAKLNRAIIVFSVQNGPQIVYDITKAIRRQKGFRQTKYTNVSRRVKALEQEGILEKAGSRITQPGVQGALYQPTMRAYVALLLSQIDPDILLKEADEETLMAELSALAMFLETNAKKKTA